MESLKRPTDQSAVVDFVPSGRILVASVIQESLEKSLIQTDLIEKSLERFIGSLM